MDRHGVYAAAVTKRSTWRLFCRRTDALFAGKRLAFDGVALAVAAMCLERPQQDRLPAEKGVAEALAVAGAPELLPGRRPLHRPAHQPPQHQRQRQVEPDQRIGVRPHDVAHLAVVADHDPAVVAGLAFHPVAEQLERHGLPVTAPKQRVELDHTQADLSRQPIGQRAFTRPRCANYDDAPH